MYKRQDALTSSLSDAILSGINCLEFTDLHLVVAAGVDVSGCTGQINLRDSTVNMSQSIQGTSKSQPLIASAHALIPGP